MVIEHIFVTTRKADEALGLISHFLAGMGFDSSVGAFQVGQGQMSNQWTSIQMRLSHKALADRKLKTVSVMLNLEYDRGRITMAVSIGAKREAFSLSQNDKPNTLAGNLLTQFAAQICAAVEHLVSTDGSPEIAANIYASGLNDLSQYFARKHRNRVIAFSCIIGLFVLAITLIIVLNA